MLSQKEQQQADAAKQASAPTQQLNTDIQGLLQKAPNASGAIQNLVNCDREPGTQEIAGAGARAQLIKDLEAAGVKAQQATTAGGRPDHGDRPHPVEEDGTINVIRHGRSRR